MTAHIFSSLTSKVGRTTPALHTDQLEGLQETSASHAVGLPSQAVDVLNLIIIAGFLSTYWGPGINQPSLVAMVITITEGETEAQRSEAT